MRDAIQGVKKYDNAKEKKMGRIIGLLQLLKTVIRAEGVHAQ